MSEQKEERARTDALEGKVRAALHTLAELHGKTFDPDVPRQVAPAVGKPGSKPPVPIGPVSARKAAADLLLDLHWLIADEHATCHCRLVAAVTDVPAIAGWVLNHSVWLARHPLAGESVENGGIVARLEAAAAAYVAITTPPAGRWIPVGPCPQECPGTVAAWLPADDGSLQAQLGAVACVCDVEPEHAWTRSQWAMLARLQGDDAPNHLPAVELARWLRTYLQARVTHRHLWNWVKRYPEVAAMTRDESGVLLFDRVRVTLWFLERRERVA
ncbi:hypothetical protein [Kineococcus gypseus]|uniref:hypothetical protein n=1 Tax=Kineococcus gypseus TaxID=1637102 RepID=UPI003D7C7EB2